MPYWNTTTSLSATSSIQVLSDSVGIGISFSNTGGPSTDHRLHVHYGTGTYGVLIEGGGAISENIPLRLWDTGTGASNINILEFAHATSSSPKLYVPGARLRSVNPVAGAVTGANLIIETSSLSNPTTTTWNTNQMYLSNDGNVGLNTGVPTSALTINTPGGSSYNGGSTGQHAIIFGSQSSGYMIGFIGTDDTLGVTYIQSAIRGGAASPILLNAQGGNIGIGVTSPAAKLHAVTNVSTIPLIIASGSTTVDLVRITQVGTGNAFVVEDSTNPDATPFVVDATGNVGVGTASPSTGLHVFSTTSGAFRLVDGTQQNGYVLTSDADGVATWQASSGGGATVANFGDNRIVTSTGTTTGLNGEANLTFDGSTLIATANSTSVPLIIASGSSTDDLVRITQTGTGNAFVVEDSTNPDATPFIVHTTGFVGVGTASPGNNLHVQGSMKLTGTFSGNNTNFVQSELITQTVLLYMSNNT